MNTTPQRPSKSYWFLDRDRRSKLRWKIAECMKILHATNTPSLTIREKNRVVRAHGRSYARALWKLKSW